MLDCFSELQSYPSSCLDYLLSLVVCGITSHSFVFITTIYTRTEIYWYHRFISVRLVIVPMENIIPSWTVKYPHVGCTMHEGLLCLLCTIHLYVTFFPFVIGIYFTYKRFWFLAFFITSKKETCSFFSWSALMIEDELSAYAWVKFDFMDISLIYTPLSQNRW